MSKNLNLPSGLKKIVWFFRLLGSRKHKILREPGKIERDFNFFTVNLGFFKTEISKKDVF